MAVDLENVKPAWKDHVPLCEERCPSHDGKRCEKIGFRPDRICEPMTQAMGEHLHLSGVGFEDA